MNGTGTRRRKPDGKMNGAGSGRPKRDGNMNGTGNNWLKRDGINERNGSNLKKLPSMAGLNIGTTDQKDPGRRVQSAPFVFLSFP